jgi:hypothetical protein
MDNLYKITALHPEKNNTTKNCLNKIHKNLITYSLFLLIIIKSVFSVAMIL